jgi:hypothetical protein
VTDLAVIASEAKQSSFVLQKELDSFVALLLAMTIEPNLIVL